MPEADRAAEIQESQEGSDFRFLKRPPVQKSHEVRRVFKLSNELREPLNTPAA